MIKTMEVIRNIRESYTFRLRKHPLGFIEGVASLLNTNEDIASNYNQDETDEVADFNSLESDWKAVGKDLYDALKVYDNHSRRS